ncbi:MAG: delta-aminolevulinic acid dehydratase [Halioglobus sp.]
MQWQISLVGVILALASTSVFAECECLWKGSFSEVHPETDLVISGTVTSSKGNSIDVSVERSLRDDEPIPQVRVWLKTGSYCRPEPELFPVGSQWVMALHEITEEVPGGFDPTTPNISYGRIGDYQLSSCGGYWLSQSGNVVTGNLINAPRWVHDPKMTPVLVDVVAQHVTGAIGDESLLQASKEDPALRELMLDTRAFLRGNTTIEPEETQLQRSSEPER